MATTKDDIRSWLEQGKEKNATHVVVMHDVFSGNDYPVFVSPEENVTDKLSELYGYTKSTTIDQAIALANRRMDKVMEVYKLSMDIEQQLNAWRAWNI